ncbi:MAG: YCF48-related protein [Chloroflexota bacterium]
MRAFSALPRVVILLGLIGSSWTPGTARAAGSTNQPAAPVVWQVPGDAGTIQEAIRLAAAGDEIQVQSGTYNETLVITKTLTLSGGWDGAFSQQTTEPSIVDATQNGRALTVYAQDGTPDVAIDLFSFTNGDASGLGGVITPTLRLEQKPAARPAVAQAGPGGADSAEKAQALRARLVELAGRGAYPGGSEMLKQALGMLDGYAAAQRLTETPEALPEPATQQDPPADEIDCGGGIYLKGAQLKLRDVRVYRNTASRSGTGAGGGVCAVETPAGGLDWKSVIISRNLAGQNGQGFGGGLFLNGGETPGVLSLDNGSLTGNVASQAANGYGGGAFIQAAPGTNLKLVVFSENTATKGGLTGLGGGLMLIQSAGVTLNGAAFEVNKANANQWVVDPTLDWLTGLGGGLYARETAGLTITSPQEARTTLAGNIGALKGLGRGGGLYVENSENVVLENSRLLSNYATLQATGVGEFVGGGGAYFIGANNLQVRENNFSHNITGMLNLEDFELSGGGLNVVGSQHVNVHGNTFRQNSAGTSAVGGNTSGGGAAIEGSDFITVTLNLFEDNLAEMGFSGGMAGGLYVKSGSDVQVTGNTFRRNRAGDGAGIGGGLTIEGGTTGLAGLDDFFGPGGPVAPLCERIVISGNRFEGNQAGLVLKSEEILLGGAVALARVNGLEMVNNIVTGGAAASGGGLALIGWDIEKTSHGELLPTRLINNTVVNNQGENGIQMEMWMTPVTLINNIISHHMVGIHLGTNPKLGGMAVEARYTLYNENGSNHVVDIDSVLTETVVITGPVQFVDPWMGDFHLQSSSAAVDAGDPSGVPPAPPVDFDGKPRPFGPAVDVGAYEWRGVKIFLPLVQNMVCPDYSGWMVGAVQNGYGVILHTENGGCSWERQGSAAVVGNTELFGIYAADAQHAWVTGNNRVLLHTTDGGQTWQQQRLPDGLPDSLILGFITGIGNELWVEGNGNNTPAYILHTTDRGEHWVIQRIFNGMMPGGLSGLTVSDSNHLWASGGDSASVRPWQRSAPQEGTQGKIFGTQNGGVQWVQQLGPDRVDEMPIAIHAASNSVVWMVGKNNMIFRTLNGGQTWERIPNELCPANDVNRVYADSENRVWIAGDGSCLWHSDNATAPLEAIQWHQHYASPTLLYLWMMGIQFAGRYGEPNLGWATNLMEGSHEVGHLFRTLDGGQTWQDMPLPANTGFWNLAFVPNRR